MIGFTYMCVEDVSCKLGADLDQSGLSQKKLKYAQNFSGLYTEF